MSSSVELESSMTGSTRAGPLKPPVDTVPLKNDNKLLSSSGLSRLETTIPRSSLRQEQTQMHHKMTPVQPQSGQPIQLTPLWEHVVRTRRFPSEVDTRETFDEITERLRDPEWEVRQHALRVLVDVLPTLDCSIIDDVMTTVLPELVNNLGYLAPAVRKGALDTLRVYLVCSRKREDIVRGILNEGLIQQDTPDNFQANLTLGVILSTPSLLFPSSSSPPPSGEIIRRAIGALANRLVQVTHQEASLRSLVKINEFLGNEEFYSQLNELDVNARRDYEILCDVYEIKASERSARKKSGRTRSKRELDEPDEASKIENQEEVNMEGDSKNCESRGGVLGIENGERMIDLSVPPSRIVLETEIKFNEETAITMRIIEQKREDSDEETAFGSADEFLKNSEEEIALEARDNETRDDEGINGEWIERRKTPRRVHFGGEIVKLRTPDSDDSLHAEVLQTRIPIPVSPTTTRITGTSVHSRKSRSNPCSPDVSRSRLRKAKSVTNSPRREFYTHDASLSPKKSILARSSVGDSALTGARTIEESKRKMEDRVDTIFGKEERDSGWAFEIYDRDDYFGTEKTDPTKDSTSSRNEPRRKRRDSVRSGNDRSINNESRRIQVDESSAKFDEIFGDNIRDSSNAKIDDYSADSSGDRESSRKNTNTSDKIFDQTFSNVSRDSSLEKSPKKSTSPKKKRNSARIKSEKTRNNEISKIRTNDSHRFEDSEIFNKNFSDNLLDNSAKIHSTKDSTSSKERREFTRKKIGSARTNNEIGKIEVNESSRVESIELVKGSRGTLESLSHQAPEEKQPRTQEPGATDEGISELPLETRRVDEKFDTTTSERSAGSCSNDRVSPRSPNKKPQPVVFETFPRKERNYILMELSSPVKTNSRRVSETRENDETIDCQRERLEIPENNTSLSGDNSAMDSASVDHSIIREANNDQVHRSKDLSNDSNVGNLVLDRASGINDEKKMPPEEIEDAGKKIESLDLEESPLSGILITETTRFRESNWEELGLVDQEVLDDLHNKDDWRARVRGLERVASALRTSSALIAIESRLGSLLQAVLGGERSCRVAAAGMAVARVVVAGVSEEALKRRLPQVAWGLARQGGPNAAQLARVAMLRLRPALLLEQLLQPHCIKARNAKTRENALQLLIFSLVTFPSTEFKVENVAHKVASMVGDKRRRVRQAALDTLAVLAQIYEPEEVTKAGKLAAKGQQDGDAMLAAIRARLARKSLPMVSADGLVLYGLQISPTVQIATGPDVDWIVAGSGSVSPGTGRTRGQIIATTTRQGVQERNAKNESTKNAPSSKGPNFVALGVGLEGKSEQKKPLAWQLVQHSAQDESHRTRENFSTDNRDENFTVGAKKNETKSRLTGTLRQYRSASDRLDDSHDSNEPSTIFILDDKDVIMKQRKTEENFHRRMDEIYAERTGIAPISQDITGNRLESRIPVPQSRDREATNGRDNGKIGPSYARRRGLPREGNNLENWSVGSDVSRPQSTHRDDNPRTDVNSRRYQRVGRDSSPQRVSPTRETYRSIYRQGRGYADGNVYREVQTAPTTTSYDVTRRRQSLKDSTATRYIPGSRRIISSESQKSTTSTMSSEDTRFHRLNEDRSGLGNSTFRNGDKSTVEEEEYNEKNKRHFSGQANSYRIQSSSDRSSQCPARTSNRPSETSSNGSSNVSGDDDRLEILEKIENDRNRVGEFFVEEDDESNNRASPANSPAVEKSFDVITHETNPSRRNSIEYGISKPENDESETDKDSSVEEVSVIPRLQSSHEIFGENEDSENDSSEIEEASIGIDKNAPYVTKESNSSVAGVSKVLDDSPISNESSETNIENFKLSTSPARVDSPLYAIRSIEAVGFDNSSPSTDENDGHQAETIDLENIMETPVKTEIFRAQERRDSENIIPILVGSRPNSLDPRDREEKISIESFDPRRSRSPVGSPDATRILEDSTVYAEKLDESTNKSTIFNELLASPENPTIEQNYSRDSTNLGKINRSSNIRREGTTKQPEVNGTQASTSEKNEAQKRVGTTRVTRMRQIKARTSNIARVAPMQPSAQANDRNTSKSKTITQQCFTQLESNDWEVTVKGLRGLSLIARQQPEQLDSCAPGTVGRLLGRHVRNLRSQVSRAACLAAGDVFGSQARCIDQDLDDIAEPLLHRTADTNKFLRADSNEALDRMVEHLAPNKTIAVIVHRGATHQNAIVRATTARLLASIVDRVGPDWTMSMPRDAREKFVASGAKLLMDGNLDARNHAKRMFRKLSRCEGFRKVLKDSVPEATLRHIDKTLKSL